MRGAIVAYHLVVVALLVMSPVATAGEIPQRYLDEDYRQCLISAGATGATEIQAQRYCGCAIAEAAKLDWETYARISTEFANDDLSEETIAYANEVSEMCNAQFAD